ncbi:MAG: amphi-Trp domain-containing protein [Pseudomonadota bacterium]
MAGSESKFRHDTLENRKTIRAYLDALAKGIGKGEVSFSNDDGKLVLHPEDLLTLVIKAERADGACKMDLRISWTETPKEPKKKGNLKVG